MTGPSPSVKVKEGGTSKGTGERLHYVARSHPSRHSPQRKRTFSHGKKKYRRLSCLYKGASYDVIIFEVTLYCYKVIDLVTSNPTENYLMFSVTNFT